LLLLACLASLGFPLVGCTLNLVPGSGPANVVSTEPDDDDAGNDDDAADDDDATADDDDATRDDDDVDDDDAADDDDATADDDDAGDDDDATADDDSGDDDDFTADPPTDTAAFETGIYCLDWSSVANVQPPDLLALGPLVGIDITDYPFLLSVSSISSSTLTALAANAAPSSCTQDPATPGLPAAGTYVYPAFELTAAGGAITLGGLPIEIETAAWEGDVAPGGQELINSSFSLLVGSTEFAPLCLLLACTPCSVGDGECITVSGEDATWTRAADGDLSP
jgi:hypothetical protein